MMVYMIAEPRQANWNVRWAWSVPEVRWAAASTVAFAAAVVTDAVGAPGWLLGVLYGACYAAGGWRPGLAGVRALQARSLDVDVLMVVAALAAAAIGQVFDGALLIVIFATSGALEAAMTQRTAASVRALLDFAPQRAVRVGTDGEEEVPAAELVDGDTALVRPGKRVPADGRVVAGESEIDQSALTGEPLPIRRGPGDHVLAGTLNGTGVVTVRVERAAAESVLARVATQVEEASEAKAKTQLFIERVEQRYSVAVVAATIALIAIPLLSGAAFEPTLLRAMTFMIVASPCAVVLATMPPLLSAIANAGRHGVLVKNAVVLERLADIDTVALDKTGTLTHGTPRVTELIALNGHDETELLGLAAGAEASSEHPVGQAIVNAAQRRNVPIKPAEGFRAHPGRGIQARVGGVEVVVGHPILLLDDTADPSARRTVEHLERSGRTAVVVLREGRVVGVLGVADTIRPDADATVADLARLTGSRPMLLTGDNAAAAAHVGTDVGIHDVGAGLLPQDKTAAVRDLQQAGRRVLLVGDGVNDAPALATADVGVAMGAAGSDLALQAADAVIVRNELAALPAMLTLARRARHIVKANLAFAAVMIVILVTWDLFWYLPLPLGVAGHETSTVIVGLNGMRLLSRRAWPAATTPRSTDTTRSSRRPAEPTQSTSGLGGIDDGAVVHESS